MSIKEAIIIAGGLGTRLQHIVKDVPKPMAEVNGRPFLAYLIDYLNKNDVSKAVLSIGYKAEVVTSYFDNLEKPLEVTYAIETEPLGTGGGVKKAVEQTSEDNVLIVNGDTYFDVDIKRLYQTHIKNNADITMSLKPMSKNSGRYETVLLNDRNRITGFQSREEKQAGLINGGVFIMKKNLLTTMPDKFSLENDLITNNVGEINLYGEVFDDYFIDIGLPEDYERAQDEFKRFKY